MLIQQLLAALFALLQGATGAVVTFITTIIGLLF
jgi:hypothetical protein